MADLIDRNSLNETSDYDAGLLNDYGGGNVEWWQDYLRAEIARANEFWRDAIASLPARGVMDNGDLAEDIGAVRLLLDTGAVKVGETFDYSPDTVLNLLNKLDRILAALEPAEAGGVEARDAAIAKMVKVAATQLWGEDAAERVSYSVSYGEEAPATLQYMHPGYNKPYPISTVLRDLAAQEGCDGEPYDVMVFAADVIDRLSPAPVDALVKVARGVLSDEQRAALNAEPAGTITTAPAPVDALVKAAEWLLSEYDAPNDIDDAVGKLRAALAAYRGEKP